MPERGMPPEAAARSAAARSLVLGRIRDVLGRSGGDAAADYAAIAREYRRGASLDHAGILDLFVDRLQHYQVGAVRCGQDGLRDAVANVLASRSKSRLVVPPGLPRDWLPAGLEVVEDAPLSKEALDRVDGVVTGCTVAIASTGTLVLCHGPEEGRRALTLVPDYHLCICAEDRVVQTVPEAFEVLSARRSALITTISGPSATADIEMTRIRGVHGPRTLDVILVNS